jgi:hypothetical protein
MTKDQELALEQAEHVLRAMKVHDEDLQQVGRLAALEALGTWGEATETIVLGTWVSACVKTAVRDARRAQQTGGIGSRRTVVDGGAAEHISMSDESSVGEEDGETSTHQDSATYQDTDCVPEGFGDAGREWQRACAAASLERLKEGLTEYEQRLLDRLLMGMPLEEHALWEQITRMTAHNHWCSLQRKIIQLQKTCSIQDTGRREAPPGFLNDAVSTVEGNPTWSQKTGKTWNDWSWKPQT